MNKYDKLKSLLSEPIANLVHSFYDQFVEENVKFRAKAGCRSFIIRRQLRKCCDWCANLAGIYEYGKEPADVFRRHDSCKCQVTFKSEKGGYTDVHSKKEFNSQREARIARLEELTTEKKDRAQRVHKNNGPRISKSEVYRISESEILKKNSLEEITEYFDKKGIKIIGFEGLDIEDVKIVLAGYDDLSNNLPKSIEGIRRIQYNKRKKDYGSYLSTILTSEVGPSGLGDYGTGIHEMAHAFDWVMSNSGQYSTSIIDKAIKQLKIQRRYNTFSKKAFRIVGNINDYMDDAEIFAYAIEKGKCNIFENDLQIEMYKLVLGEI